MLLRRFARANRASVAVESAFIFPAVAMMIVGTVSAGIIMCSVSGLHSAVQAASRCYSINSSKCGSASATQTYALGQYYGMSTPTFTAVTASCGHQVSGSLTLRLDIGLGAWSVPVNAVACYP